MKICTKKKNPVPIVDDGTSGGESTTHCYQARSGMLLAWKPDGPTLRFQGLLKVTRVGRSKAYEKMKHGHPNFDPTFPVGVPLFDSKHSPKFWWYHDALAWNQNREAKARKNSSTKEFANEQ